MHCHLLNCQLRYGPALAWLDFCLHGLVAQAWLRHDEVVPCLRVRCTAGLLNVLADISGMLDAYMDASVHLLRASVKEVIAVPKPEPLPAPKVAPPPPPPSGPAKPSAPPPPPPPGEDTSLLLQHAYWNDLRSYVSPRIATVGQI